MKKLISFLVSGIMAVTASMTSSIVTGADESVAVTYTIQDVKNLQDFLLTKPTEEDLSGKPYDLNGDDRWDVFDLCLMKGIVVGQMDNQNDALVVYFSRTGNTEKIAEYLIDITHADSYVIEAAVPYTDDDIAYTNSSCRANKEQNDKAARPEIANPIESIDSYDVIYLGYPIWWGEEPRIIDTFLESYDFSDKIVVPFCTSASSGNAASERNIANLVPIENQLEGKRFSASASKESVETWLNEKQAEISDIRKSSENMHYTLIKGGTFQMGSPESEPERSSDEIQHSVTVGNFYMSKTEISQKEYQEIMDVNPSATRGDDLPVTNITWYDAVQYCNKLSQKDGLAPCYTISGNTVT